jgi:hypothetical protein
MTKTKKEINARPSQYQIAEGSTNDSPLMSTNLNHGRWVSFRYRNFKVWTLNAIENK